MEMIKKEFIIGQPIESDTEYYAKKSEYHVYARDAVRVCDGRYVALRAHDAKEFDVFTLIKDKKNVTLDFCGATLVMHGKIQPFLIDGSENVTVKNCRVTYDRPPFTEALITKVSPDSVRLRLNERCPCRVEDGQIVPFSDTWENRGLNRNGTFFQVFDKDTRKGCGVHLGVTGNRIVMDVERPFKIDRFVARQDGDEIVLKGDVPEFYRPGRVLVFTHEARSLSSVFIIDSKNTLIENYRIIAGWGMGIYTYRAEDLTLDGVKLTHDELSPCIVANAADAVHCFGNSGKMIIKGSVFEGMIDDALNVHSNFRTVAQTDGDVIVSDLASCEPQAADLFREGDLIAVYRGKTMEEAARYVVKKIGDLGDGRRKFVLDRPAAAHEEGDLIENITANCELYISDSVFGKANSHLRLQTRGNTVMKNCQTELPLYLTGDASYWFESGPLTDLTVENCRFVGERARIRIKPEVFPTDAEPYYHKNLKILNNEFETAKPLEGGYVGGITFKGNSNSLGKPMTLVLTNCGGVDAENCAVERKTEVKTKLNVN
ncbi:MAG: hypothetical protein IJV00_05865 [Clostridia bacterium]|nr:hypothetical protein [Clostridia bacterium]